MHKLKIAGFILLSALFTFSIFSNKNTSVSSTDDNSIPVVEIVNLEEPKNVSNEDTLITEVEQLVSTSEYLVERDGVKYKFLFTTPSNVDYIVEEINKIYEDEFKECIIAYSNDLDESSFQVTINSESFLINAVN